MLLQVVAYRHEVLDFSYRTGLTSFKVLLTTGSRRAGGRVRSLNLSLSLRRTLRVSERPRCFDSEKT